MRPSLWVLAALHLLLFGAGWFSVHSPEEQRRDLAFAPPTLPRIVDEQGRLRWPPFVYAWKETSPGSLGYAEDRSRQLPWVQSHWLGTDWLGRDVWARLLHGGRISLFGGILATTLALLIGALLGGGAGAAGGWLDTLILRAGDVLLAVPWFYLLLAVRAAFPLDVSPVALAPAVSVLLALVGWVRPARLIRGIVLVERRAEYVLAARGFGASRYYILRRHLLPPATRVLAAQAPLLVAQFVTAEVALSFLGLGLPESIASWGGMLASAQRLEALSGRWWLFAPAAVLVVLAFSYQFAFPTGAREESGSSRAVQTSKMNAC